ncbi:MAG: hypothetical protein IIA50_04665 [Bacteroidetes bacterium]|nr:hypothetical protein [Bacteroidota bacterium]
MERKRVTATLAWLVTEYQKIEFSARTSLRKGEDQNLQAIVRVIVARCMHGVHEY